MKQYFWHGLYDDVENCKHLHEMSKGIGSLYIRPIHGGGGAFHNHINIFTTLMFKSPFIQKNCEKHITVVVSLLT